jgi:TonB family protein
MHKPLPSRHPATPTERAALVRTPAPRIEPRRAEPPILLVKSPDVAAPDKQPSLETARSTPPPVGDAPLVEIGGFATAAAGAAPTSAVAQADASDSFGTVQPDRRGARWRTAGYERSGFGRASRSDDQFPKDPSLTGSVGANNSFGSATVVGPTVGSTGQVHNAGFGQVVAGEQRIEVERAIQPASGTTAARVLAKPMPQYTSEARQLRIEGDVRLRVTFRADATVEVLKVVEGLGHGLDQNAVRAARKIEFAPAERNGKPVDFTADVFIRFRLAY